MPGEFEAFEDLERYPVDPDKRERMFAEQLECVVAWTNSDGWPVGVMHWFVWAEGRFWVTSTTVRKRVAALKARPASCVIVSSVGTSLGPAQSVTAKTLATVHDDPETKGWFYRALADKAYPDRPEYREYFHRMLHGTVRIVIELEPVQWISYDAMKMHAAIETG
jgi:pyridoxamine 5'-phosphate oxidase-like protein